jgi:hypothetical protein
LAERSHAELHLCVVEMKGRRPTGDVQKLADLPRRLSWRRRFETLELARRQRDAVDDAIGPGVPTAYSSIQLRCHYSRGGRLGRFLRRFLLSVAIEQFR